MSGIADPEPGSRGQKASDSGSGYATLIEIIGVKSNLDRHHMGWMRNGDHISALFFNHLCLEVVRIESTVLFIFLAFIKIKNVILFLF
jgi:hypothetical protein